MAIEILLRYIHFVSIFMIAAALVSEHLLLKKFMTKGELSRIATVDAIYGMAALTLLAAGLTLWLGGFGKPSVFYSMNWIFHLKVSLFATIGLLSIYPTVFFVKNSKGVSDEVVTVPTTIFWLLRFELVILFTIPLLAGLMARGVGFFG